MIANCHPAMFRMFCVVMC